MKTQKPGVSKPQTTAKVNVIMLPGQAYGFAEVNGHLKVMQPDPPEANLRIKLRQYILPILTVEYFDSQLKMIR